MKKHNTFTVIIALLLFFGTSYAEEKDNPKKKKTSSEVEANRPLKNISQLDLELQKALNSTNSASSTNLIFKDNLSDLKEHLSPEIMEGRFNAQATFDYLDQGLGGGYQDEVNYGSLIQLPVGLKKKLSDKTEACIGISNVTFFKDYALVTLFVRLVIKNTKPGALYPEKEIYFGAKNVKFTKNGGLQGSFEAALLGDYVVEFEKWALVFKGNDAILDAKLNPSSSVSCGSALTYCKVVVDCSQFQSAVLSADVVFPRDFLVPFNELNGETSSGRVTANFTASVTAGLNDMIACVNFDKAFTVPNHDKFGFKVSDVKFDFSDSQNPTGITNVKYEGSQVVGSTTSDGLWRGFYAENIEVLLPQQFREDDESTAHSCISISAKNIIIDNQGFSGTLSYLATPLTKKELNASKWRFDLDKLNVSINRNQFVMANFGGTIRLPISSDGKSFLYEGLVSANGNFTIAAKTFPGEKYQFNCWRSTATLTSLSITFKVSDKKFLPSAKMSGSLSLNSNVDNVSETYLVSENDATKSIDFRSLNFIDLELQTEAPQIKVGPVSYSNTGNSFIGFPVVLKDFAINLNSSNPEEVGSLNFTFLFNLLDKSEGGSVNGLSVFCSLKIPFKEGTGPYLKYVPKRIMPVGGGINAEFSGFKLEGGLFFEDVPGEYKEFRGGVNIFELKEIGGTNKKVGGNTSSSGGGMNMLFGVAYTPQKYRYFVVDGMAKMSPGIPLGPVRINELGVTLCYHAKPKKKTSGTTFTYLDYEKDLNSLLQFKALAGVTITEVVTGTVAIETKITKSFGLENIGLWGVLAINKDGLGDFAATYANKIEKYVTDFTDAVNITQNKMMDRVMSNAGKSMFSLKANPIEIRAGFMLDRLNKNLLAEIKAYVNLGIIKGDEKDGLAGGGSFYDDWGNNIWYLEAGRPDRPNTIRIGLAGFGLKTQTYMMMGNKIPNAFPPPISIIKALNLQPSQYNRSVDVKDDLSRGLGMALGMSITWNLGFDVGIYYDKMEFTLGGESYMKKVTNRTCELEPYYGRSSVYVGVERRRGRFQFGTFRRIETSREYGAAVLEMGTFNPFYIKGTIGATRTVSGKVTQTSVRSVSAGTICN